MLILLKYILGFLSLLLLIVIALLFLLYPSSDTREGSPAGTRALSLADASRQVDAQINSVFFSLGLAREDIRSIKTEERKVAGQAYPFVQEEILVPLRISLEVVREQLLAKTRDALPLVKLEIRGDVVKELEVAVSYEDVPTHLLRFTALGQALAAPTSAEKPRVAIVIEGLGSNLALARELIAIPAPLTLSIVPQQPYSIQIAEEANSRGHEVILYLAGEPPKGAGGPSLLDMTDEEVVARLRAQLRAIPYLKGVDNRLSLSFTQDSARLSLVLNELKEAGLYYFDGRTTRDPRAYQLARSLGIKTGEASSFLDNVKERERVYEQLVKLSQQALKAGSAVAVGQAHPLTIAVLRDNIPKIKEKGFELVPLSRAEIISAR